MKKQVVIISLLVLSLVLATIFGSCTLAKTERLQVVTSTSLLTYIVQQVGGDKVDVFNIVPPAQHPGDFDANPGDIQRLASASLFLVHGWPGETWVPNLVASANNPNLKLVTISVDGNWMTPSVQMQATDKVADALGDVDRKNNMTYQKRAAEYKVAVLAKEANIMGDLVTANLSAVNVICASFQADFVKWTGMKVVATYGTPESFTPQLVKELVDKGRAANVTLIVDNLHSGRDAGKGIAEELGCKRIILLNFPGGFDNTETWEKAIDYNIEQILKAVAK
ncbi:MAG TPA: metal ABC transporter substrate-binding protein [Dehalococcoidales bacterium]